MKIKLLLAKTKLDPLADLERYIRDDTHQETLNRVDAVQRGWAVARHTPIHIPPNIYYASGPWENFSTPGRDIRLRLSYLSIPKRIQHYVTMSRENPDQLVPDARDPQLLLRRLIKIQHDLFEKLTITYPNSRGDPVTLSLRDVEQRLFLLSFDPNHPPELRWGASGKELESAARNRAHYFAGYRLEQPWRNRLSKKSGPMQPSDPDNPKHPPEHDISRLIRQLTPPP